MVGDGGGDLAIKEVEGDLAALAVGADVAIAQLAQGSAVAAAGGSIPRAANVQIEGHVPQAQL